MYRSEYHSLSYWKPLWMVALILCSFWVITGDLSAASSKVKIEGVRVWNSPDKTRLVFDINKPVSHNIFSLEKPDRIVIDLKNTATSAALSAVNFKDSPIKGIRVGLQKGGALRVVLDAHSSLKPKSHLLKPNMKYGHRLVVDLFDEKKAKLKPKKTVKSVARSKGHREVIVAIDAGHGGEDPGAVGPGGIYEKNVNLAIALKLRDLINAEKGMRAVMTRDGDYYVKLKRRREIARDIYRADLFISLHADAWKDHRARGASVWVLSQRGATKALNRYLENLEKESDSIGGVDLNDKDDVVKSVLVDLAMEGTLEHSFEASNSVLKELKQVARMHKKYVEQAGFVVLKSPDMPSMLVELGFISNPHEESLLSNRSHQKKIARALVKGVKKYFVKQPPPGTYFADLQASEPFFHKIAQGETLSEIAKKYSVSTTALKRENSLRTDRIKVGQALKIPNT